jgi:hypothetical protein
MAEIIKKRPSISGPTRALFNHLVQKHNASERAAYLVATHPDEPGHCPWCKWCSRSKAA